MTADDVKLEGGGCDVFNFSVSDPAGEVVGLVGRSRGDGVWTAYPSDTSRGAIGSGPSAKAAALAAAADVRRLAVVH